MAPTNINLKLLIDKKAQKVIFAEAGKDFIDFLFNLLSLPIGGVIRLIPKETIVGCLGNLYSSVKNLNHTYMQPKQSKDSLLKPRAPTTSASKALLLLPDHGILQPLMKFYCCGYSSSHKWVSENRDATCPDCGHLLTSELKHIASVNDSKGTSTAEGGFVKCMVTYMVMDNLSVMPLSMISTIAVLNSSNVSEFVGLEEKVVDFGIEEGLKLLEASLTTKAALSYVFLKKEFKDGTNESECVIKNLLLQEMLEKLKE